MAFVSRDLMVNVLYQMAGEGDRPGCTPSPTTQDDDDGEDCTPSPPTHDDYDKDGCTPSPGNCTPSPPGNCTPSPPDGGDCTPSPNTGYGEDESPLKALAFLRQQLRETLAQA
jgi:hypothetical protein